jgi:hypothetical protein
MVSRFVDCLEPLAEASSTAYMRCCVHLPRHLYLIPLTAL